MASGRGGLTIGTSGTRKSRQKTNKGKDFKRYGLDALKLVSVVGPCGWTRAHGTPVHGVCRANGLRL